MFFRTLNCPQCILTLLCCSLLPANVLAQRAGPTPPTGGRGQTGIGQLPSVSAGNFKVFVRGADGAPVDQLALVSLTTMEGQNLQQATAHGGYAEFTGVAAGSYNVEVVAPGYDRAVERLDLNGAGERVVTVALKPASDGRQARAPTSPPILAPKAKKELGKALEAMRAGKLPEARGHLDVAYHLAPGNPEVNYIFGIYSVETNDLAKAHTYFENVLNFYPKQVGALRTLGIVLLRENKPTDAVGYLQRAVEAEPASWLAHALLADACLRTNSIDESIVQAERALELGHGQAAIVQPLLARALTSRGDKERAILVLQSYLEDHPSDAAATKQLEDLRLVARVKPVSEPPVANLEPMPATPPVLEDSKLFLPSSWLPPDVDEKVPPVEPGAACSLNVVMKNAGERVREFVTNVDRFTATESITHETINKWGLASPPEKFKFDYLVSIEEISRGSLNVEEFRPRTYSLARFPDGVERNGLPTLVLIFHPYNAGNFEMTCEGLAHWNGGLAWQVHFRQRTDRPNTIRVYRLGQNGPSYPAALKGRAWISADSYQIVRLETDLVAPMPEIRLVADHAAVDYGPVNFRAHKVAMWLPQTAEFYYDWRGHRGHRIHRFTDYLLFSVDDKQRMSAPKADDVALTCHPGNGTEPDR
jgi:tetratricopeptide (TPR) repeat protein